MQLKSIPSIAAAIYLTPSECVDLPGITLGKAGEVDLTSLRTTDPSLAAELEQYYLSALDLWSGGTQGMDTIKVKYSLAQAKQKDTKEGKTLLRQELVDLVAYPMTKAIADLLLDEPKNLRTTEHSQYTLIKEGDMYTAVFVGNHQTWPKTLGGPKHPGEEKRYVSVSFSYAKWRDSKIKKLTKVVVDIVEVWPKPSRVLCGNWPII